MTRKTAQLYAPVFTLAPVKGTENQSWLSLLTKEVVPLLTYWESKESYFLSEEPQLTVREETEKNPESEKTQETQKVFRSTETHRIRCRRRQKQNPWRRQEKTVIQKAVKRKRERKQKRQQTEETKEQQETVNMEELQEFPDAGRKLLYRRCIYDSGSEQINAEKLAGQDLRIKKDASVPQILIYHTHSQEAFADSEEGNISDTIVGMGNYLTELLENKYGYNVIHNTSVFDMIDGVLDRNTAYNLAETEISSILAANPTVEVVIDLHRDGLDGEKLVTQIDGKQVAKIMFFNGLSRTARNGNVDYLPNPYIEENLAFSFQLQIKAQEYYPGFTRHIYLQSLRYNLHLKPRALLIEAGSQLNTVEEEKNAMERWQISWTGCLPADSRKRLPDKDNMC